MSVKRPVQFLQNSQVVVLDYTDLLDDNVDLSESFETAYGFDGLGILTVRGVPNVKELRQSLLPLAHKFANLPEDIKQKTVHEESFFSFGWSHGKEFLEGKPDLSKGSYYNNPVHNAPFDDQEIIKKYPAFAHPNIWPSADMPELEPAFLNMGKLLVSIGELVARGADKYVKNKVAAYPDLKLHKIIKNSRTAKARLLHYFPIDKPLPADGTSDPFSSWCGWHNDHGSLTGLVPAMYIDPNGKEVPNPDPQSGLYIRSRKGDLIKVNMPADHLAFQIGETAQVHSGGVLQATPHCVRAAATENAVGVSRETFAVFMEPQWDEPMNIPEGTSAEQVCHGSNAKLFPPGVPVLATRWKPEQDFGKFTEIKLKS
eukprot:TRINITY_DN12905_c0_g1_i1.p1 TRINITY_DN12905_c0_g1~~TRINITY_DN12905_c0_g1_i1.p1  ORF type:complete len:384 (+),score=113.56 TRINITY_DN12905_c0_g1_i1:40-1152(+)